MGKYICAFIILLSVLSLSQMGRYSVSAQSDSQGWVLPEDTVLLNGINPMHSGLWIFGNKANVPFRLVIERVAGNLSAKIHLNQVQSNLGPPQEKDDRLSDSNPKVTFDITPAEDGSYQVSLQADTNTYGDYRIWLHKGSGAAEPPPIATVTVPTPVPGLPTSIVGKYRLIRSEAVDFIPPGSDKKFVMNPGTTMEGQLTITPSKVGYQFDWLIGTAIHFSTHGLLADSMVGIQFGDPSCTFNLMKPNQTGGYDVQWFTEGGIEALGSEHLAPYGTTAHTYVVTGSNPDGKTGYQGEAGVADGSTVGELVVNWIIDGKDYSGIGYKVGNYYAIDSADKTSTLHCTSGSLALQPDGSMRGYTDFYIGKHIYHIFLQAVPENSPKAADLPINLAGAYNLTTQAGEKHNLTIQPLRTTYKVTEDGSNGKVDGVALRWDNKLAVVTGAQYCSVVFGKHFEENGQETVESFFAALGNDTSQPGSISFEWRPKGPDLNGVYNLDLTNENDGEFVQGKATVTLNTSSNKSGAAAPVQIDMTLGTNTYKALGIQDGEFVITTMPLGKDATCVLRVLTFANDGTFTGRELDYTDGSTFTVSGGPSK